MVILNTELMRTSMEIIIFRDKITPLNEEEDNVMSILYLAMAICMVGLYVELGKGHEA